jgi:hypothetical protein
MMSARALLRSINSASTLRNHAACVLRNTAPISQSRAAHWYPDQKFMEGLIGPVMYNETTNWRMNENWVKLRTEEREVNNMHLNFGPQHPAAHGVLRYDEKGSFI